MMENQISFDNDARQGIRVIFTRKNGEKIIIAFLKFSQKDDKCYLHQNENFPTLNLLEMESITKKMKAFEKQSNTKSS